MNPGTTPRPLPPMTTAERARFELKYVPEPNSGCWLWIEALDDHGYGRFNIGTPRPARRTAKAHRVSYEAFVGPIPPGLDLDHLCRVRCCVNPDHLEPVTNLENCRRALSATFGKKVRTPKVRTHCKHGHVLDEANVFFEKPVKPHLPPARRCLTCRKLVESRRVRSYRSA